jgi:serine protease AprX
VTISPILKNTCKILKNILKERKNLDRGNKGQASMKKTVITIIVLCTLLSFFSTGQAQSTFWVSFKDKSNSGFSITRPLEFLSEKSVQRRSRQHIPFNETDLPVIKTYTDSILKTGATYVHSSRWLNGITVILHNDSLATRIRKYSFVREVQLTKPSLTGKNAFQKFEKVSPSDGIDSSLYGPSVYQVGQLKCQYLHKNGFKGKGMLIAVLDAGFYHVNQLPAFDSLRQANHIIGVRDFVNSKSDIFEEHTHGMMVLSLMGGNLPGQLIGTAPEASYWLLRSEDANSEYLVEEDNWVVAAEFADSVGADVINSSLGYYTFDLPEMNHSFSQMDGKTTRVAKAANLAFSKGILVCASAGNEGNKTWHYFITPSDGDSVISVAAVDKDGVRGSFSSIGPAPDGNVKPDLAAMGVSAVVENTNGKIAKGSGTSFSSPVLAGTAACLWQAHPNATASQIRQALIRSGSLFQHPDSLLGYGIPDMVIANALLSQYDKADEMAFNLWTLFPNPFHTNLILLSSGISDGITYLEIVDLSGKVVTRRSLTGAGPFRLEGLNGLPSGLYLLKLTSQEGSEVHKIIKSRQP